MKTIHSYRLLATWFAIGLLVHAASAQTATWNAASGNWSDETHWSPPSDPNLPSFTVIFNNGGSLTLDGTGGIGSYSQTGGVLTIAQPQTLVLASNSTLGGGGVINIGYSYISQGGANVLLTNVDGAIQGYGEIGFNGLSLLNQTLGVIQANGTGQSLFLNGGGTFTNNGVMRALNGGRLVFDSSADVINNATIRSENASEVRIQTLILGGGLDNVESTGLITLNNGTLRDVIIAAGSTVTVLANGRIENTLVNHGTLSDESNTNLVVGGDTTFSGGGIIKLGFGYLRGGGGNQILTNADNTLRGYGEIGVDSLSVINGDAGIIQADVLGQTLRLNGGGTFTNNGLVRSQNGGALTLDGSAGATFTNTGGTLQALDGTTIFGVQMTLLQTSGTLDLAGGNMNFPLGVDLNGGQLVGNGTFTGPIRSNGGTVGPGHSAGRITVIGDYTQGANGTLEIEIGGRTAATHYDQLAVNGTASLDGTLNLKLINGFRPIPGDVFQIITPTTFSGAFSAIHSTGFTGQVNYNAGAITVTVLTVPDIPLNISTRLGVKSDPNQLIGGLIITGTQPKRVLIRGIGPSLGAFLTGALANPTLELFQDSTLLESNDNWRDTNQAAIEATGIAPTDDMEAAIVRTLDPGAYTAVMRGVSGASGVGVVEAYDLDQAASSKMANISTRGFVDTGDNAMIGGFIMGGNGGENGRVVIRAIGPSLTAFGITGALQDPVLELRDSSGSLVASNDNWQDSQQAEIEATGLAPTDTHESVIVISLGSGGYTSVVRGKDNGTGVGLVEAYNVVE